MNGLQVIATENFVSVKRQDTKHSVITTLSLIRDGDKSALSKHVLTLAQHIAYGGWKEAYVKEFLHFPSQTVNSTDPQSNRTLLHLAATINSTDVLELVLRHFSFVDCVDNRGITPAFLAAEHGLVDNLALLAKKGAKLVSGHEKVVSRLISEETNALNCYDYTGRTPLHEAVRKNDAKLVDILLEKQPQKIHYKCYHWQNVGTQVEEDELVLSGVLSIEESIDYHKDICHCGYTPLHLAARYGHENLGISLIFKRGAHVDARDCSGATALHVAACHNQQGFVNIFSHSKVGGDINSKTLNGSSPLHSAAACGAVEVIDYLLYWKANLTADDNHGMTPLHYSILNVKSSQLYPNVFLNDSCVNESLIQRNATLEKRDKQGKTPLEVAIENATIVPKHLPFALAKGIDELHGYINDHEMVVSLLLRHGASFKRCKRSGSSLLHRAIVNQQPYSVQLLLLKGASLTCKDSLGRTPLVTYLQNGGNWTDVVLKHFNVSVAVKCGKPFNVSVFHLLSYRPPTLTEDNFFEYRKCDRGGECDHSESELRKGPLAEAIESHPLKHSVINSCLDADGFTPLHRASQGANLVAIRYLLANGANDSILSPHGYDALSLAVLHAGSNLWRLYGLNNADERLLGITEASDAAIELLHHAVKTRGYRIRCDSSKPELTLYHLAASRGLVKFIDELFKDRKPHQLDVDCPNMDGITPMYLAKLFGNKVKKGLYNPWDHVVSIIKSHGVRCDTLAKMLNII
ncbi:hypothetical protein OS493_019786 [Desmophyllum pertusum]|uniref:Uncharacterized protein n=1 Tax=Desmophyllum pertusum TaxID=174260 RepID=A0A9X0CR28_9CNID|nr:hypothetical protein OS493_019786 [Desmophyllum pertusum]